MDCLKQIISFYELSTYDRIGDAAIVWIQNNDEDLYKNMMLLFSEENIRELETVHDLKIVLNFAKTLNDA